MSVPARRAGWRSPRRQWQGCEVIQYTPNQVKDAVAGWGGAGKEQVQKMVQARLKLATLPRPADAADAAAVALTSPRDVADRAPACVRRRAR